MLADSLVCSFRNLGRKKFRSFLTICGIAIGVASVVLIGSIGEIGKDTVNRELSSLGLGSVTISTDKKFTNLKLSEEDLALIRSAPSVRNASPIVVDYSSVRMRGLVANSVLWGMDGANSQIITLKTKHGRLLNQTDLAGAADVCVVDSNMANMFYHRENIVGKHLDAMIGGSYVTLEIVGVASSGGYILQSMVGDVIPSFAYVPYSTLQRYKGETAFEQIAVTLRSPDNIDSTAEQLTSMMNRSHNLERGFKIDNISQQKDTLNNMMSVITIILSAIAAVSLVVAGLGIMTVMLVSVNERTREIGIKKSIGATKGIIMVEFMIEAFAISVIGSIVGVIVGLSMVWLGCALIKVPLLVNFNLLISSVGLSIIVGMVFGVYPATVAAKMRPVDALRIE